MSAHSVYWHDGMFMWPHHMQLEERLRTEHLRRGHQYDVHYNWGVRSLEIDEEALRNHRFVVKALKARMKDGALIDVPADGLLPALDLQESLAALERVMVYLALPRFQPHQANVPGEVAPAYPTRYLIEELPFEDENSGDDPQPIQVRRPHLKLLLDREDLTGYEILPIARIARTPGANPTPQVDLSYIPPLLACDAWKPLQHGILQTLHHRFGARGESLAQQISTRGITFDTRNPGDSVLLGKLSILNEAFALLNTMAFAHGVHPLQAYGELCRMVGQLAIFQDARKAPDLPRYDHDDLAGCFYRVKQHLDEQEAPDASYEERPFVGEGLRMQVALEPKWLEPVYQMYVGVQSPAKPEEVIRLLTKAGQLDMKIGSGQRVDVIFERGMQGLEFTPVVKPPRILPSSEGLTYFQVNRDSNKNEWQEVQKSKLLAIRLNQNKVAVNAQGNIQGLKTLTIRLDKSSTTMQFSLFLAPQEK